MDLFDILPPPDRLSLEIGLRLVPLACSDLIPRLADLRRAMGLECGIDVPPIRVRDNAALEPRAFSIRVYGAEAACGTLPDDSTTPILKQLAKAIREHASKLGSGDLYA